MRNVPQLVTSVINVPDSSGLSSILVPSPKRFMNLGFMKLSVAPELLRFDLHSSLVPSSADYRWDCFVSFVLFSSPKTL